MNIHVKSSSVAENACKLASVNSISRKRSMRDAWADNVTRLAGDEVQLDEVQTLMVEVRKADILSFPDMVRLSIKYLGEKAAA